MSNGSRKSDAVSHGGAIVSGSGNVLTNGLATARLGDAVACALHGPAVIGGSSSTVLVNGRGFARIGDGCICGGGATAGPGTQDLVQFLLLTHQTGLAIEEILRDGEGKGPQFSADTLDANHDGTIDTMLANGTALSWRSEGDWGHAQVDVLTAEMRSSFVEGRHGVSVANEVEAHGARGDLQFNLSDRASVSARGGFGNAKAGYDVLAGDDGQRIGLGGHGGATASVFQGELSGSANGTIGEGISTAFGPLGALLVQGASSLSPKARDLLNTPVEIEATVSGSAISAGADGEAVAYYDRETGQTTAAIGGEIAALLGLGCDLRITIGEDKSKSGSQSDSPGATGSAGPNVIVGGSGTVLVGG